MTELGETLSVNHSSGKVHLRAPLALFWKNTALLAGQLGRVSLGSTPIVFAH